VKRIFGNIEGKEISLDTTPNVAEQSPSHFLVHTDSGVSEVFLIESGMLSNGNSVDGLEVRILTEKERIIHERFMKNPQNENSVNVLKGMILKAPMPGMVRAISVSIDDKVQKNTQVLVLEAMKMENAILAGYEGIVTKIHVESGMSVEKNTPLLEFRMT